MLRVFRKENKYIVPIEQYIRLKGLLDGLMERDQSALEGTYQVRSQYYDSILDQDLFDNLTGQMEKRKIRLRVYSPKDKKVKLEYKCKSGTDGLKLSMNITRDEALLLEDGKPEFLLNYEDELAPFLYWKINAGCYRPRTITEYTRTAFIYSVSDTRITFDQGILGSVSPYGFLSENKGFIKVLPEDRGILEVKYNDFLPPQLKKVIEKFDHSLDSYSKYTSARMAFLE